MKKSQITLFMLFGLLILLFAGFFLLFFPQKTQTTTETTTPTQTYVEQCIEDVGNNAIEYVSLQGGYYNTPEPYYQFGQYAIAYIFYNNTSLLASQQIIEQQLGLYVDERLERCIANFSTFTSQGYDIQSSSPQTTVSITENSVVFSLDYPITATKDTHTTTYSAFTAEIPSALYLARNIVQEVIDAHDNDTKIPLSKLTRISEKYNVTMNLGNFNTTVIYAITLPEQQPSLFMFAIPYRWGEESE